MRRSVQQAVEVAGVGVGVGVAETVGGLTARGRATWAGEVQGRGIGCACMD